MKFKWISSLALLAAMTFSGVANAGLLTYTIEGNGSGSLGGADFVGADFVISMVGDTDTFGGGDIDPLESASVSIAGLGTTIFNIDTRLGISGLIIYFSRSPGGLDLFDFRLAAAVDLTAPFAPVAGTGIFALGQFVDVDTTLGLLTFVSSSDVIFQAGGVEAVPTPTTILLFGLGLAGLGWSRRKKA